MESARNGLVNSSSGVVLSTYFFCFSLFYFFFFFLFFFSFYFPFFFFSFWWGFISQQSTIPTTTFLDPCPSSIVSQLNSAILIMQQACICSTKMGVGSVNADKNPLFSMERKKKDAEKELFKVTFVFAFVIYSLSCLFSFFRHFTIVLYFLSLHHPQLSLKKKQC